MSIFIENTEVTVEILKQLGFPAKGSFSKALWLKLYTNPQTYVVNCHNSPKEYDIILNQEDLQEMLLLNSIGLKGKEMIDVLLDKKLGIE